MVLSERGCGIMWTVFVGRGSVPAAVLYPYRHCHTAGTEAGPTFVILPLLRSWFIFPTRPRVDTRGYIPRPLQGRCRIVTIAGKSPEGSRVETPKGEAVVQRIWDSVLGNR